MHNKNNNKTQTFTQGLRPFSSSVPKTLRKHLRKNGYNYSHIVDNWIKIVKKKTSDACYPANIKMEKGMKNGTLTLNVIHGKELEVEYEKNEILEKINSFFGYQCIDKVVLKIIQNKSEEKNKINSKIKDLKKIEEKIKNLKNENLRSSLKGLLKAYNERN